MREPLFCRAISSSLFIPFHASKQFLLDDYRLPRLAGCGSAFQVSNFGFPACTRQTSLVRRIGRSGEPRETSAHSSVLSRIEEKRMKFRFVFPFALAICVAPPVYSQRRESHAKPEPERHPSGHVNTTPDVSNDHWYGHDRPNDAWWLLL
jgi:hypothetical protein